MEWSDNILHLQYIALILASPEPTHEQIDQAQMADFTRWIRYRHVYYTPTPDRARQAARVVGGEASGPFVLVDVLIGIERMAAFDLIPIDPPAVGHVFFPYYAQCFGHLPREVVALLDPTSRIGRGAIIHPSTRIAGHWQVTAIDQDGPTSHTTVAEWRQAVLGCLNRGMHNPVTHKLDALASHWILPGVRPIK